MQPKARTVGRIQLPAIAAPLERKTLAWTALCPQLHVYERKIQIFMYFAYVYCSVMLRSNYGMSCEALYEEH